MAKGDDIEERLIDFAVRIVKLCVGLPKTSTGQHQRPITLKHVVPRAHETLSTSSGFA